IAAAVSAGGGEQIRFNAADQAAARAVVIRRADLGSSGWQGGRVKPDLSGGPTVPNYHPKVSDLVITGAAKADFRRSGFEFASQVQVLQTRRMGALDWRRSVLAPGVVSCLRRTLANGLGSTAKVNSFAKLPFPHLSTYFALSRCDQRSGAGSDGARSHRHRSRRAEPYRDQSDQRRARRCEEWDLRGRAPAGPGTACARARLAPRTRIR